MRVFETDGLSHEQKEMLRSHGYFVYDMRDCGDEGYTVEAGVWANHMGNVVTDTEIKQITTDGYINDDDYEPLIDGAIQTEELYPILKGTQNKWGHVEPWFK